MGAFEFHIHIPTSQHEFGVRRLDKRVVHIIKTLLILNLEHDFTITTNKLPKLVHVLLALDVGQKPMRKASVPNLMYLFQFYGSELVPIHPKTLVTDMQRLALFHEVLGSTEELKALPALTHFMQQCHVGPALNRTGVGVSTSMAWFSRISR